ncbi:MAG: hypothetical protein QXO15_09455, partial [Nitrososphaerota archaeon]
YNPVVDELLKNENKNPMIFDKIFYMKKVSICEWKQCNFEDSFKSKSSIEAIAICFYRKIKQ